MAMTPKKVLKESVLVAVWFVLALCVYVSIDATNGKKAVLVGICFLAWSGGWVSKTLFDRAVDHTIEIDAANAER